MLRGSHGPISFGVRFEKFRACHIIVVAVDPSGGEHLAYQLIMAKSAALEAVALPGDGEPWTGLARRNMASTQGAHDFDGATTNRGVSNRKRGNESLTEGHVPASMDPALQARARHELPTYDVWKSNHKSKLWVLAIMTMVVAMVVLAFVRPPARGGDGRPAGFQTQSAQRVSIGLKLAPANLDIRNQSGSSLDQVLIGNVYEGIVARDSNNKVVPALAKSWVVSNDALRYTFTMNTGMTFSNGDRLNAEDAAWSVNELVKRGYHDAQLLKHFESAKALDNSTLQIVLTAPYSDLLWVLTGRPGLVFDRHARYDMKTQAIGSGPYTVERFVPNSSLTLVANSRYRGPYRAKTASIVLHYYNDDNAAINALKSGDIQVLAPITQSLSVPFDRDSTNYDVKVGEGTDKFVLAMNCKGSKTSDVRIREAIRMAIDHKAIVASRGGVDRLMGGPIAPLDPGYEDLGARVSHTDVRRAAKLLKEAGYDRQNPLALRLEYANIYGTELGDQLRSQLREIGINLQVHVVEFSTWMQDVYTNKNYDLSLVDHNESHDFSQWADRGYYYNYDNPEVRNLYDQAMSATTEARKSELLQRAARVVSSDSPADWLFNYRITTVMRSGVSGFPINMNQALMPLWNVTFTHE